MAVTKSIVSERLYTTVALDTTANLSLDLFNDANTTLYAMEVTNPNSAGVYIRVLWTNTLSGKTTSTQYDNCHYIPAESALSIYCGTGYLISSGIVIWCSTETGVNSLSAPARPVSIKMAYKNT